MGKKGVPTQAASRSDCVTAMEGLPFRVVPGFPGYGVTIDGRVWSRWKRGPGGLGDTWKAVVGGTDKDGYKKVILCRNGRRHHFRVHLLVLCCFVGPCPPNKEARHANNVRDDNRLCNLNYATHVENIADKVVHGTSQVGSKNGMASTTEAKVRQVKRLLRKGKMPSEISRLTGVSRTTVYGIKYQGRWAHVQI